MQKLIRTDADIHTAVKAWFGEWGFDYCRVGWGDAHPVHDGGSCCKRQGDPAGAEAKYGHISWWDVSRVTSMRKLFECVDLNEDIRYWDVSNVKDMSGMFACSSVLFSLADVHIDLDHWEVRSDCKTQYMFISNEGSNYMRELPEWCDDFDHENFYGLHGFEEWAEWSGNVG